MHLRSHIRSSRKNTRQATGAVRSASCSSKRRPAQSKSHQNSTAMKTTAEPIVAEPDSSEGEDVLQWADNEKYRIYSQETRPLFTAPSAESDVDSDSEKENADAGADDDDPFGIDPVERAEAERFLKEQERLQERHRKKFGASATANQSTSAHTSDSLDLGAINARLKARDTTRVLSFGDDVPSCDNWEMLSAAARDIVPDGEADPDQLQAGQFVERDLSARYSMSTFGSGSTRSTFYRESPSPTRAPVQNDVAAAATLKTPVNKLRFDNDSSDGEAEEPSPASAVSYKTANEPISSYESVASASEHSQRLNPRSRFRFGDYTSSPQPGNSSMESNDYVLVDGSRKRRSNIADSFDVLGSLSQKMRKIGVGQALSNTTVADSIAEGLQGHNSAEGSEPQKAPSEINATTSGPPLFEVIRGEPHGYTFTRAHLGSGNFGVVNVAVREYAVKRVNGKDPEAVHQCTEGVALLRRVNHENIIRMKEAFHDVHNDIYYVVMDKMEGSVADLIEHNRGYLTEEHALVILRCTAKALEYLHNLGFVHRDVKSDNVLVGRNCEVKLADLDSAAAVNAWLNGIAGTPHWVAPEVARIVCKQSTAPYTAKVDVWSFAIFATEFALGVPPYFTGEKPNIPEVCGTICNPMYVECVNDMVRVANCPDVARLVEYCLKAAPTERPNMSDVQALMSFLPEPGQQVLLEPIQRMVECRAKALQNDSFDGYDSFDSQQ